MCFAIMVVAVVAVAVASGNARWDRKLPDWWQLWVRSMLVLTALPEEAAFRGVIQERMGTHLLGSTYPSSLTSALCGRSGTLIAFP